MEYGTKLYFLKSWNKIVSSFLIENEKITQKLRLVDHVFTVQFCQRAPLVNPKKIFPCGRNGNRSRVV
jgi:hypothetical protein